MTLVNIFKHYAIRANNLLAVLAKINLLKLMLLTKIIFLFLFVLCKCVWGRKSFLMALQKWRNILKKTTFNYLGYFKISATYRAFSFLLFEPLKKTLLASKSRTRGTHNWLFTFYEANEAFHILHYVIKGLALGLWNLVWLRKDFFVYGDLVWLRDKNLLSHPREILNTVAEVKDIPSIFLLVNIRHYII